MYEKTYEPYERGKPFNTKGSGDFSRIEHVKNRPDFLAKKLRFTDPKLPEFKNLEELSSYIERRIALIKKYIGQYIPEYYITYSGVKSDRVDDKEAYIFMKEVTPLELEDEKEKMKFCQQLDGFIEQSGQCYLDNYNAKDKKGLAPDLSKASLIYGQIGVNGPQLYYIDLFPLLPRGVETVKRRIQKIIAPYQYHYNFPKTLNMLQKINNLEQ